MSLSVSGTNPNNPFAYLQFLQQPGSTNGGAQSPTDPLSALLSAIGQQGQVPAVPPSGGTSPTDASSPGSANPTTQFGPQTLQALLALQDDAASGTDPNSSQSQDSQPSQVHHHHHHGGGQSGGAGGGQNPLDALLGANGTTSQTVTNANGSTTTTITYADGSTVTSTGAASGGSGNLLEQLIQMQAQLVNPASTQNLATV